MVNPVVPVIKTNRNPLLGHLVSHTNRHYPNTMFNGPPLRHKSNVDVEYQTEWIKLNIWHQFKMPHPHMKLVGTRVSTRVRAEGLVKGSEIKTCTNDSYFMGHPIPTLLLRDAILIAPCRLVEIGRRFIIKIVLRFFEKLPKLTKNVVRNWSLVTGSQINYKKYKNISKYSSTKSLSKAV